ncbi:hypothetical protein C8F04DRAFT_1230393 [Mycena alexandri]|uniref:Uncharacterized protein n=1 Tax=Mycena alexandri TaxID=1745969 RepID=A0AAD6TC92_9AGAR|nr:hypothetical protein C8F04DRAFT_1230393 [Mycena alexandri]
MFPLPHILTRLPQSATRRSMSGTRRCDANPGRNTRSVRRRDRTAQVRQTHDPKLSFTRWGSVAVARSSEEAQQSNIGLVWYNSVSPEKGEKKKRINETAAEQMLACRHATRPPVLKELGQPLHGRTGGRCGADGGPTQSHEEIKNKKLQRWGCLPPERKTRIKRKKQRAEGKRPWVQKEPGQPLHRRTSGRCGADGGPTQSHQEEKTKVKRKKRRAEGKQYLPANTTRPPVLKEPGQPLHRSTSGRCSAGGGTASFRKRRKKKEKGCCHTGDPEISDELNSHPKFRNCRCVFAGVDVATEHRFRPDPRGWSGAAPIRDLGGGIVELMDAEAVPNSPRRPEWKRRGGSWVSTNFLPHSQGEGSGGVPGNYGVQRVVEGQRGKVAKTPTSRHAPKARAVAGRQGVTHVSGKWAQDPQPAMLPRRGFGDATRSSVHHNVHHAACWARLTREPRAHREDMAFEEGNGMNSLVESFTVCHVTPRLPVRMLPKMLKFMRPRE